MSVVSTSEETRESLFPQHLSLVPLQHLRSLGQTLGYKVLVIAVKMGRPEFKPSLFRGSREYINKLFCP